MMQLATGLHLLVFAAEFTVQLWYSGTSYAECLQYHSFTSLLPTGQHPPCHPAFLSYPLSFSLPTHQPLQNTPHHTPGNKIQHLLECLKTSTLSLSQFSKAEVIHNEISFIPPASSDHC
jgi:hypothetical protein